ncbi:unnamed protein product [Spirodela intermedia]|uniref:Uncharacterized protein n=1 Tax=Spirodela intermedia TaxID=51605 RepID=A0A7I8K3N8_SPIIN|nr:unnamed protein product [Spirodela intermedia]
MEAILSSRPALAATSIALLVGGLLWLRVLLRPGRLGRKKKRYAPLVCSFLNQIINFRRIHDYLTDKARRFKCFRILHPGRSYVYLTDPRDVEYILSTNFANYGKGSYNNNILEDLLGDGIFAVDGDQWRHQRKLASFEFSTRNLRDYSSNTFKHNAGRLAQVISEAASSNRPVDIQDLLMRSTMDSIFKVGFGVEIDALRGTNEEGARFSKAFDDASEQVTWRYADVMWKIKRVLNVGAEAALRRNIRVIDNSVYKIIDQKIEQLSHETVDSMRKDDLLSRFLGEREKEPDKISRKYLRDIILNFMIAGKDTTASTLSWFFYMMCKHPNVQEKVAEEIDEATKGSSPGLSMEEFTENLGFVDDLPYLHAALNETMRFYPAVPQDPKTCFSDDTLPNGFDVKAGDIVVYFPYGMGRLKDLWGDDAEDFQPERWLDDGGNLRHESPFKFTAFQAGPRVCLGREFAYRQMKIFAAVLLHFFAFEMTDDGKDVSYRTMLTLQTQGLRLRAFPRQI